MSNPYCRSALFRCCSLPLACLAAAALLGCQAQAPDDPGQTESAVKYCPDYDCDPIDDPPDDDPPPDPLCTSTLCTPTASCQDTVCQGGCYDKGFACTVGTCSITNCNAASFSGQGAYPWHTNTYCTDPVSQTMLTCKAWYDAGGADCDTYCAVNNSCSSSNLCRDPATGQQITCRTYGDCDLGTCATVCGSSTNCLQPCTAGGGLATNCETMGLTCDLGMSCGDCQWTSDPSTQCRSANILSTCGESGRSTRPVAYVDVALSTGRRRLVQGWDGGHHEWFCGTKDLWSWLCVDNMVYFDGLQLIPDPSGAWFATTGLPAVQSATVRSVNGPYQGFSEGKWEWKEGTTNDWTYRRYDLVSMRFANPVPNATYPGAVYLYWDEDDGLNDDDFDWVAPMGQYLRDCLSGAKAPNTWHTSAAELAISNRSYQYLCDSRGCGDGEYEVRYDVKCSWSY